MSVKIDLVSQARDLPELLEWLAEVLRIYPKQRWSLQLKLRLVEVKDCRGDVHE